MTTTNEIGLLALLVAVMGYVQLGSILQSRPIRSAGVMIAVLCVGAFLFLPASFSLAMAILGGGLLIGTGLWMVRSGA